MEIKYKGANKVVDYQLYQDLFSGYAKAIHNYRHVLSNGVRLIKCLDTLNMPKMIGEDYASLILGEKLEIKTDIEEVDMFLEDKFIPDLSDFLERMLIVGQAIIVPYVYQGLLKYKFYYGSEFKVVEWFDNRPMTITIKEEYMVTTIKVDYTSEPKTYITYEKDKNAPRDFELPMDYEFSGVINYFKPNITNNITNDNQGLSVIANAIDILKSIDKTYTDLNKEFDLSRKRMFVGQEMITHEETTVNGEVVTVNHFDEDEYLYQFINSNETKDYIQTYDSNIRINEYEQGIKLNLKLLSQAVGLDEYYDFDKGLVSRATATQVISDNSKLFRNKKKHEHLLEKELRIFINSILSLLDKTANDIVITFDDAIIIDDDKRKEEGLKLYDAGVLSLKKLLIDYLGYSEDEANQEMNELGQVQDFINDTDEDLM